MNHAKKMVLVPEHTLERLQQRQNVNTPPLTTRLNGLDHDIQDVLKDDKISEDEKVRQYSQALQNYLTYYNQRKDQPINVKIQPPPVPVKQPDHEEKPQEVQPSGQADQAESDPGTTIEREIIQVLPKTLKDRGKMLMEKIKENPEVMKWDDRGQLVFEGKPLKGSHISDLIKDSLRSTKKLTPPLGYDRFTQGLAKMNAPDHLVGNKKRKTALRNMKAGIQQKSDDQPVGDNEWFPTPLTSTSGAMRSKPTRGEKTKQRWLTFRS